MNTKQKVIACAVLFLASQTTTFARQVKLPKKKATRISSVSLLMGSSSADFGTASTLSAFKSLAPGSTVLSIPVLNGSHYYNDRSLSSNNAILLGIELGGRRKAFRNMEFRIGLNNNNFNLNYYASESNSYRLDTLKGNSTAVQFYLDSIRNKNIDASYNAKMLGVDMSLLFKSNPSKRFSLYGGFGVNYNGTINSKTNLYYNEWWNYNTTNSVNSNYGHPYFNNASSNEKQVSENYASSIKANITNIYIPLGINFRLSNKNYFFKHINLFAESRPSLSVLSINDIGIKEKDISNNLSAGIKISF